MSIHDSIDLNNGLRDAMAHRRIGQEKFGFVAYRGQHSTLDELAKVVGWGPVNQALGVISCAAKGEPAWPPLALFKAMLLSIWYDLSDVKLAEALDDRASFRRFCGFSASEPTPERTAFVRLRRALVERGLDKTLFEQITRKLKAKAIKVKTGTLVDATIIPSASEDDGDARWVKHRGKPAVHGFKLNAKRYRHRANQLGGGVDGGLLMWLQGLLSEPGEIRQERIIHTGPVARKLFQNRQPAIGDIGGGIAAFMGHDDAPVAKRIGRRHQLGGHPAKPFRCHHHPAQGIDGRGVETAGNDDQFRPKPRQRRDHHLLERGQIGPVTRSRRQRDVDVGPKPVPAAPRIQPAGIRRKVVILMQ